MAKSDVKIILYAVDLDELRDWLGCADQARFDEAWAAVRENEDADWEPEELEVLERLLRRVIFEGRLYDGLTPDEVYYLTQLLIDLFDEFVDQDALSEDLPLDGMLQAVDTLPRNSDAAKTARWLVRGRQLNGEDVIWNKGEVEEVLAYFGYLTREEAAGFVTALDAALARTRTRPSGLLKQLRNAAEECAQAELDLVSFVG